MKLPTAKETGYFIREKVLVLERYYQLVKRGSSPEQTREDLLLSVEDIRQFDFSVFENKGNSAEVA